MRADVVNVVDLMQILVIDVDIVGIKAMDSNTFFTKMIDELVRFSEYDPELKDGIKWLDERAQKKGISFYDMVFEVLYKHDVRTKAREWLRTRN